MARSGGGGWLWRTCIALLLFSATYLAALVWFVESLPRAVEDETTQTDAVVVLTGGSERVQQGLALLDAQMGRKLFISGVYHAVDVNALIELAENKPGHLSCCIMLGYEANDTHGNALETAAWMAAEGYNSLRLVTAVYHMPRSLIEFRRAMPRVKIIPHPVYPEGFHLEDWWRWPGSASLLAQEFAKYLLASALAALGNDPRGGETG